MVSAVLVAVLLYFAQIYALLWIVIGAITIVTLAVLSFYRNPCRPIPQNLPAGSMISPADGVISAIEYVDSHEAVGGKAVIIRIFLSVLNVHINRAPCDCKKRKSDTHKCEWDVVFPTLGISYSTTTLETNLSAIPVQ